ncbi:MAG: hypothetical protein K2X27_13185 [Candidatus Obscuribacterales bacterium]|nr:hypothetical protein [Candidatus Obscuribacterales bacterium]
MLKKSVLCSVLAAMAAFSGLSAVQAYPERPSDWRCQYEAYYFPVRVISMLSSVLWDVPTGSFQDGVKGAIGGTKMVARNLGNEDGPYDLVAGALTGGPVGLVGGSIYGVLHGFGYGASHGFMGYDSPHSGSHCALFQGRQYVVPYDGNY